MINNICERIISTFVLSQNVLSVHCRDDVAAILFEQTFQSIHKFVQSVLIYFQYLCFMLTLLIVYDDVALIFLIFDVFQLFKKFWFAEFW